MFYDCLATNIRLGPSENPGVKIISTLREKVMLDIIYIFELERVKVGGQEHNFQYTGTGIMASYL